MDLGPSLFKIQIHDTEWAISKDNTRACRIPAFAQMLSFLDSPMNWANSSVYGWCQVPEINIKDSTVFDVKPRSLKPGLDIKLNQMIWPKK